MAAYLLRLKRQSAGLSLLDQPLAAQFLERRWPMNASSPSRMGGSTFSGW